MTYRPGGGGESRRTISSVEADIRANERERVLDLLDDLRKYTSGEYKEAELSDNEHDMRIHLEYENRIWEIMIELRQSKDGE
jgi:hypothetical protein